MKIRKEDIGNYLPHRAPFIMVDNLIEAMGNVFETDFEVLENNIFLEGGTLREFALIENIAQSCAAGLGYSGMQEGGTRYKDGFMGGISALILHELPKVGDVISTVVTKQQQLGNMYLFHGRCRANGRELLECKMKLVGTPVGKELSIEKHQN
jgi:predicted hotdog family 3-hydroxylacyl-ACP dehydratase